MKHITGADKSMLVGDEAATILLEYAAFLANGRMADTVMLSAYSITGEDVTATLLLNEGATIMAESTHSSLPEPDNEAAVAHMREAMSAGSVTHRAVPADVDDFALDHES